MQNEHGDENQFDDIDDHLNLDDETGEIDSFDSEESDLLADAFDELDFNPSGDVDDFESDLNEALSDESNIDFDDGEIDSALDLGDDGQVDDLDAASDELDTSYSAVTEADEVSSEQSASPPRQQRVERASTPESQPKETSQRQPAAPSVAVDDEDYVDIHDDDYASDEIISAEDEAEDFDPEREVDQLIDDLADQDEGKADRRRKIMFGGGAVLTILAVVTATMMLAKPSTPPRPPGNNYQPSAPASMAASDVASPNDPRPEPIISGTAPFSTDLTPSQDAIDPTVTPPGAVTEAWRDFVGGIMEPIINAAVGALDQRITNMQVNFDERLSALERASGNAAGMAPSDDNLRLRVEALEAQLASQSSRSSASLSRSAEEQPRNTHVTSSESVVAVTSDDEEPISKITPDPDVIFDAYSASSPNGIFTQIVLSVDPRSRRVPSANEIRVDRRKATNGDHFLDVSIPNSVMLTAPPAMAGVVSDARTQLFPEMRRLTFTAKVPVDAAIDSSPERIVLTIGPQSDTSFQSLLSQSRQRSTHQAAIDSAASRYPSGTKGHVGTADGRVVDLQTGRTLAQVDAPNKPTQGQAQRQVPSSQRAYAQIPAVPTQATPRTRYTKPIMEPKSNPEDWVLAAMTEKVAIIMNPNDGQRTTVMVGSFVDDLGRILSIEMSCRRVKTEAGYIYAVRSDRSHACAS